MSSPGGNNPLNDQASIEANRAGQITPWQRQQLKPPLRLSSLIVWIFIACTALLTTILLFPYRQEFLSIWQEMFSGQSLVGLVCLSVLIPYLAILLVLLVFRTGLLNKVLMRCDLAEGYIAQEDGQVVFLGRQGYIARVAGQLLRGIDGSKTVRLEPGMYHFYYLPRSRRILSAEPQARLEPGGPQDDLLLALARAHRFSLDDLNLNRQGLLSRRQRAVLGRKLLFWLVACPVVVVIITLLQLHQLLQAGFGAFMSEGLLLALLLALAYPRWRELREGRVAALEGYGQPDKHTSKGRTSYYYKLGRQQFDVSSVAYRTLVPGMRYRLYYLPRTDKLVSIEPLPQQAAQPGWDGMIDARSPDDSSE